MSEMSCKTCRRWAAGWCLAQQLGTSRDEVCNAWELSQVVGWEDENEKLQARVAELEAFINQLIEAGDGLVGDCELNWKHNHTPDCPPANHWQALVDDWKEG